MQSSSSRRRQDDAALYTREVFGEGITRAGNEEVEVAMAALAATAPLDDSVSIAGSAISQAAATVALTDLARSVWGIGLAVLYDTAGGSKSAL